MINGILQSALQLAIINQESSFNQFAKPQRKKILGFIPGSRPSTAFGYAQVTNPTWDWYKTKTGNKNASRANFNDITDFIGWYTTQSENISLVFLKMIIIINTLLIMKARVVGKKKVI